MTWFEGLTGFRETSASQVHGHMTVDGDTLTSLVNGRTFTCGQLETPSLGELRNRVDSSQHAVGQLSVREVVADVSDLHADESNGGCLFQVASQFNLLEMAGPSLTPDDGVGIYEHDLTQGPACAIAAGAGTIYRNYFAVVNNQVGQSAHNQIDCLADIGVALGNSDQRLWTMTNGYALASREGLIEISNRLDAASADELDQLRQRLRIGIQWNTQVTIRNSKHTVTQAYCSALPVDYCNHPSELWESFARLVLEASYEATICTAILNSLHTGNNRVFLTLIGGGVFGNETDWIMDGLKRALKCYKDWNLEVAIVSHGRSKPHVQQLVEQFS
ncbi:MAG: hypothetical protein AAFW84_10765 [Cyanobacteria bacterium J06635_15]